MAKSKVHSNRWSFLFDVKTLNMRLAVKMTYELYIPGMALHPFPEH